MRRIVAAVSVLAAVAIAVPSAGGQFSPLPTPTPTPTATPTATPTPTPEPTPTPAPKPLTYWQKNGCERKTTVRGYRWRLRTKVRYSINDGHFNVRPIRDRAHRKLHAARSCAASKQARRKMLRLHKRHRKTYRWVAYIDRITVHGDYAVPTAVVNCEGGVGDWNEMNNEGSGAAGPYQLLGWGAPMPAEGHPARQARHHQIAYSISDGGSNLGPWESSRPCWG